VSETSHESAYDWHYRKTSDLIRQLSFAGLALVWLISEALNSYGHGSGDEARSMAARVTHLRPEMLIPAFLFVSALFSDLLQLFFRTYRLRSKPLPPRDEGPMKVLALRLALVIAGYALMFAFAAKFGFLPP
jgi:hypothetical protein